jgi:hypothetical protein
MAMAGVLVGQHHVEQGSRRNGGDAQRAGAVQAADDGFDERVHQMGALHDAGKRHDQDDN